MADENQEQEQNLDTSESQESEAQKPDGILKGDEKDLHRIASWLGRVDKASKDATQETKQTLEKLSDTLEAIKERLEAAPNQGSPGQSGGNGQNDPLEEIGNKLQNALLTGGKDAALEMENAVNIILEARNQQQHGAMAQLEKHLGGFEKQSFFKDIETDVRATAQKYVNEGMRPDSAAKLAFSEKRADYFAGMIATIHKTNPAALETLTGGKKTPKEDKKPKLPPDLQAACDRDIAAGVFKDEADYIANLSHQIRTAHGL